MTSNCTIYRTNRSLRAVRSDWFENADVNVWLNQKEKEKARQLLQKRQDKAEAKRRQMRVCQNGQM